MSPNQVLLEVIIVVLACMATVILTGAFWADIHPEYELVDCIAPLKFGNTRVDMETQCLVRIR